MIYNLREFLATEADDLFDYQGQAKHFSRIIINEPPPFVTAVMAEWGGGKTSFLKFLVKLLPSKDDGVCIVYFNAWKNSIYSNYLVAFIHEFVTQIRNHTDAIDDQLLKEEIVQCGSILFDTIVDFASGLPSANIFTSIYRRATEVNKRQLKYIIDEENRLRSQYQKYCSVLAKAKISVYVIVDDLDRCSPGKAVSIIESIRNLFIEVDEIENEIKKHMGCPCEPPAIPVKFILSLDPLYLAESIKSHHNMESIDKAKQYLLKFIQFPFQPNRQISGETVARIAKKYDGSFLKNIVFAQEVALLLATIKITSIRDAKVAIRDILVFLSNHSPIIESIARDQSKQTGSTEIEMQKQLIRIISYIKIVTIAYPEYSRLCVAKNIFRDIFLKRVLRPDQIKEDSLGILSDVASKCRVLERPERGPHYIKDMDYLIDKMGI